VFYDIFIPVAHFSVQFVIISFDDYCCRQRETLSYSFIYKTSVLYIQRNVIQYLVLEKSCIGEKYCVLDYDALHVGFPGWHGHEFVAFP
jgi:hypothetical protein